MRRQTATAAEICGSGVAWPETFGAWQGANETLAFLPSGQTRTAAVRSRREAARQRRNHELHLTVSRRLRRVGPATRPIPAVATPASREVASSPYRDERRPHLCNQRPPISRMRAMISSIPSLLRSEAKWKGRSPRMRRLSRCITSSEAPT